MSGLAELSGVRWRFTADRPLTRGPVAAGDLLVVTDVEGGVYALDPASGEVRWRHRHRYPTGGVIAAGEWVLVDDGGDLWVHDRSTGRLAADDVLRVATGIPLSVTGDVLLLLDGLDHDLRAVDLRSETELWRTGRTLLRAPVAVGDGVVVGAWPWEGNSVQGGLQGFDLATGEPLWFVDGTFDEPEDDALEDDEYWEESALFDPFHPVISGGQVLITRMRLREDESGSRTRCELAAFDPRTGRETGMWIVGPAEGARACCAVGCAAEGLAYLIVAEAQDASFFIGGHRGCGGDPRLTAIDPRGGRVAWTRGLDSYPMGPPVPADGLIYAFTGDGVVHCFDAPTGEPRWLFTAEERAGRSAGRVWDDWGEDAAEEPPRLLPADGVLYAQTATSLYALE